jgi:hypothetical protein
MEKRKNGKVGWQTPIENVVVLLLLGKQLPMN